MKKKKVLCFFLWISGLIILMSGVFLFALGIGLQEADSTKLLLKILGTIAFLGGVVMLGSGLFKYYKGNKALEIAEKDERNIAIRGRAAQLTCLITSFLLLTVIIIFMFMELIVATLIIGAVMLISSFMQIILIAYYDKKSSTDNDNLE